MDKEKLKTITKYVLGAAAVFGLGYATYLTVMDYRKKGDRLAAVEIEVGYQKGDIKDLKDWSYKIGATVDHNEKRIYYLERDVNKLQLKDDKTEKRIEDLENKENNFENNTNTRLTQIEKTLEESGTKIVNIQAEINNKIVLIEKNLININDLLSDVGPTEYSSPEGFTSLAYQKGKEIDYVGFSIQKPNKSTISVIERVVAEYSEGMQKTKKQFKKETGDGTIYRTEFVYRKGNKSNMLFVEEKLNSVYVFMKLAGNNEREAFRDMLSKCQLPVTDNVKKKLSGLGLQEE